MGATAGNPAATTLTGAEASQSILKLQMNETIQLDANTRVKRVPGGWIYLMDQELFENEQKILVIGTSCFVSNPGNNSHNW